MDRISSAGRMTRMFSMEKAEPIIGAITALYIVLHDKWIQEKNSIVVCHVSPQLA